jgi:hypothetical protein
MFWLFYLYIGFGGISKLIPRVMYFSTALIAISIVFMEPSYNRFELWWPSYLGGVHTTSYSISILVLFYCLLFFEKHKWILMISVYLIGLYSVMFGWGVRTAFLFLIFVPIAILYSKKELNLRVAVFIFAAIFIVVLTMWSSWDVYSLDALSSGRLSMYDEKIYQIKSRGIMENLLGSGAGSDLIETEFWWGEKGAHNDYMTFLVEFGLIGFICLIVLMMNFYKTLNGNLLKSLYLAALVTSIFSNGIIVRPVAFYLLTFLFIYIVDNNRKRLSANVK